MIATPNVQPIATLIAALVAALGTTLIGRLLTSHPLRTSHLIIHHSFLILGCISQILIEYRGMPRLKALDCYWDEKLRWFPGSGRKVQEREDVHRPRDFYKVLNEFVGTTFAILLEMYITSGLNCSIY